MVETPGDDLLSDDLLDGIELLSSGIDHDDFATFLEFFDPESSAAHPAFSGASCVANEGDVQSLHNAPPFPQQSTLGIVQANTARRHELPEAAKLERIRAKNRRGQAKYREKLKVLTPASFPALLLTLLHNTVNPLSLYPTRIVEHAARKGTGGSSHQADTGHAVRHQRTVQSPTWREGCCSFSSQRRSSRAPSRDRLHPSGASPLSASLHHPSRPRTAAVKRTRSAIHQRLQAQAPAPQACRSRPCIRFWRRHLLQPPRTRTRHRLIPLLRTHHTQRRARTSTSRLRPVAEP